MERLFIYGTLAPGRPNEHILKNLKGTWQTSSVKGRLSDIGWGSNMGYSGIVLDSYGYEVSGYVFTSEELSEKWDFLDNFEGDEYERVLTQAKLQNGEKVNAYVYALRD